MFKFIFKIDNNKIIQNIFDKNLLPSHLANEVWNANRQEYVNLSYGNINPNYNTLKNQSVVDVINKYIESCEKLVNRVQLDLFQKQNSIEDFLEYLCNVKLRDMNFVVYVVPNNKITFKNNEMLWGYLNGKVDIVLNIANLYNEVLKTIFDKNNISNSLIDKFTYVDLPKFLEPSNSGYKISEENQELLTKQIPFLDLYLNKSEEEIEKEKKIKNIEYDVKNFKKFKNEVCDKSIFRYIKIVDKFGLDKINLTNLYEIL